MPTFPRLVPISSLVWQKWRKLIRLTLGIRSIMSSSPFQCPSVTIYDEQLKITTIVGLSVLRVNDDSTAIVIAYGLDEKVQGLVLLDWSTDVEDFMGYFPSLFYFLRDVMISFSMWLTCETRQIKLWVKRGLWLVRTCWLWYFWFTFIESLNYQV